MSMVATGTPRLGPVSYVVLGLLSLRGPSTPYDLKKAAERSVTYFWTFPHSQVYSECDRLAGLGLLDVEAETEGRRRKVYELSPAGRTALDEWFGTTPDDIFEMRDMAVLQLFFSDRMSTEALVGVAERQVELYDERLRTYAEIAERQRPRHHDDRRMAPLTLGVMLAETFRRFWAEVAAEPPPACDHDDRGTRAG